MSRLYIIAIALALIIEALPVWAVNDSDPQVGPTFSGAWFDPAHNGEGFLLEILDDGRAVVYWFTYDDEGNQRWIIGVSAVDGNRIEFQDLLVFSGPVFGDDYDVDDLASSSVGSALFEFTSCSQGVVSYVVDGLEGSQQITTLTSIAGHDCAGPDRPSSVLLSGLSGSWYLPEREGEGIVFEVIAPGTAMAYWFTFNKSGAQAWFFGLGAVSDATLVIDEVYAPTGPTFGPGFDPDDVELNPWGSMTFDLSCDGLSYSYNSGEFGTGQRDVGRLTRIGQTRCLDKAQMPQVLDGALEAQVNPANFEYGASWGFSSGITGTSWRGAAGKAGAGSANMTRNHAFKAGPLGEIYTAALIFLLAEQGLVDIDAPMAQYLDSELTNGLGEFRGQDHTAEITLRQLLSHRSGMPDLFQANDGPSLIDLLLASPEKVWSHEEILEFARQSLRAESVPGTDLIRSDLNFVLLAEVAETVTGQSLAEAFRARISAPLGMESTWLLNRESAPIDVSLAAAQLGDTDITMIPSLAAYDAGNDWATTTADLGKFLAALASDGLGDGSMREQLFATHANYIGVADYGLGAMVRSGDCSLPEARLMGSLGGGAFALIIPERQSMVWGFNSRLDYFGMGYAADLLEAAFGPGTCRDAGTWPGHDTPEEGGFSSTELASLDGFLDGTDTAALIAVVDGKVLYQYGLPGRRYASHSIRKVFLSALYDAEVKSGLIILDSTMGDLGISDVTPLTNTEKTATVKDLLKARSGIYLPAAGSSDNDPLPPRGSAQPGAQWFYNNWDFNALATVYENATGDSLFDRFIADIGKRVGMDDIRRQDQIYLYERLLSDHPMYMFTLTARDMARFGQLYLDQGLYLDKRIIRKSWVNQSTTSYSDTGSETRPGFGYMNWSILENGYMGTGSGGHKILVLPAENMVVVIRVDTYNDGHRVSDSTFNQAVQMILDARE